MSTTRPESLVAWWLLPPLPWRRTMVLLHDHQQQQQQQQQQQEEDPPEDDTCSTTATTSSTATARLPELMDLSCASSLDDSLEPHDDDDDDDPSEETSQPELDKDPSIKDNITSSFHKTKRVSFVLPPHEDHSSDSKEQSKRRSPPRASRTSPGVVVVRGGSRRRGRKYYAWLSRILRRPRDNRTQGHHWVPPPMLPQKRLPSVLKVKTAGPMGPPVTLRGSGSPPLQMTSLGVGSKNGDDDDEEEEEEDNIKATPLLVGVMMFGEDNHSHADDGDRWESSGVGWSTTGLLSWFQ